MERSGNFYKAIVGDLLYSIRCTIVVQWHFYAIF